MDVNPARRSAMTLYSDPRDHYSHRVRLVLAEKGIAVDVVDVNPSRLPQRVADVNPDNTVPTLVDRELALYQSNVIMEYLDERFSASPVAARVPGRARPQSAVDVPDRDGLEPALERAGEWPGRCPGASESACGAARERGRLGAGFRGETLFPERRVHLGGFCCVAPILWRLEHVDIDLPERQTRPLARYMQKIFARQSFRDSLTELEVEMRD